VSFSRVAIMSVLTITSLTAMENAQATVITPDQAIRVNFTYTGEPTPEANGIYVSLKTDYTYPAPDAPAGIKFYATLYQGALKVGSSELDGPAQHDPYIFWKDFISESSPYALTQQKYDVSPFFGSATGGTVVFSSNMNFNFNFESLYRTFEISFSKDFSSLYRTFANEQGYPYAISYEIISNPSAVPEPNNIAYLMCALAVISLTSLRRKQS